MTNQAFRLLLKQAKLSGEYQRAYKELLPGNTPEEAHRLAQAALEPMVEAVLNQKKEAKQFKTVAASSSRPKWSVTQDLQWVYQHFRLPKKELNEAMKGASGGALALLAQCQSDDKFFNTVVMKLVASTKAMEDDSVAHRGNTVIKGLCEKLLREARIAAGVEPVLQGSAQATGGEPQVSSLSA